MSLAPVLLFHRDFTGYSGGHGKVWHYFQHALEAGWDARVYLTPRSLRDASNPWVAVPERVETTWQPQHADALFLGGEDWLAVPEGLEKVVPVFNLIQGVRHADAAQPLRRFLRRRATRVCVGQPVAEAILGTGEVHGPVVVIPAAIDVPRHSLGSYEVTDVFVDAGKRPALGELVAERLRQQGHGVRLLTDRLPRGHYLDALSAATVVVLLPLEAEGFYLPPLEAMSLGVPVVTLDAVGNRAYLEPGTNALVPPPDPETLVWSVRALLSDPRQREALISHGQRTAALFDLSREREMIKALWKFPPPRKGPV